MDDRYRHQVALLIRCLPIIEKHECFALKGGTAINLFVRDLPRLSVDIDLAYLPLEPRKESFTNINNKLDVIADAISVSMPTVKISGSPNAEGIRKLIVQEGNSCQIKIEVNYVIRGSVYKPEIMTLCARAEDEFQMTTTIRALAMSELYGSKLVATLDRQHPRDLFDTHCLKASGRFDIKF